MATTAFPRIARQLNYKQRTLTSAITARLEIPGFSYEAFEQGGGKIQPWSAVQLLESTLRYFMYPDTSNNHLQQKSFADLHLFTEDFNFYSTRLDVKINKYLYEEQSPKFPLFATIALDYVGKSSKRSTLCLHHTDVQTAYVECIFNTVLVSQETKKAVPYPEWWVDKFKHLCKNDKQEKLFIPSEGLRNHCHSKALVNLSDIDVYKHTNTASYLKYFYESIYRHILSKGYKNISQNHFESGVKSVTLEYTGQSVVHDELDVTTWEDAIEENVVYGKIEKNGYECCHMKMEFYNDKLQSML